MKVSRIAGAGMPDEILDRDSAFWEHRTQALKLVDFVSKDGDNRLVTLEDVRPEQERNLAGLVVNEIPSRRKAATVHHLLWWQHSSGPGWSGRPPAAPTGPSGGRS